MSGKRARTAWLLPRLATLVLMLVAAVTAWLLYSRYMSRPWTRDGQVRADMVRIAPRVSGYLVEINVTDNQAVQRGDLLFLIDPAPYQLAVDKATVALAQARESAAAMEANVRAAEAVVEQRLAGVATAKSRIAEVRSGIDSADSVVNEAQAGVLHSRAMIAQVEALLNEANREATRARRLASSRAVAVETAEAKEAKVEALEAELVGVRAGLAKSTATLDKARTARVESELRLTTAENGLTESQAAVPTAMAARDQALAALGETGDANVQVRAAKVALEQAELNLEWTSIRAPADGFVTNMNLKKNTMVAQGQPFALFVDASSFRVDAYFQETKLRHIEIGDRVAVTIMGHRHRELEGEVESMGYAINPPRIADTDGSANLVPTIAPTFEWIRLAQRVPVRIRLKNVPEDLHLVSGMTASIAVRK